MTPDNRLASRLSWLMLRGSAMSRTGNHDVISKFAGGWEMSSVYSFFALFFFQKKGRLVFFGCAGRRTTSKCGGGGMAGDPADNTRWDNLKSTIQCMC